MTTPLRFRPLYMERPWGGRMLATLYGRPLPDASRPYGESWEMVDRESEQSVVAEGPWTGRTLHELWMDHRVDVFGPAAKADPSPRFPLLVKILDASDTLSLQVHPPPGVAERLGGEPKTEMWYVAQAQPGAELRVGVTEGTTRATFEAALAAGTVAGLVPRLPAQSGDSIFIPSGRLHAIGAGLVIFEIQQNSDTTYRVFDWNRPGLDGKPRPLHLAESLASIDFADSAAALNPPDATVLADCASFRVERIRLAPGEGRIADGFRIVAVAAGRVAMSGQVFGPGDFFMIPATARGRAELEAQDSATMLEVSLP